MNNKGIQKERDRLLDMARGGGDFSSGFISYKLL